MLLAGPDADGVVADTTGDDLERDRLALLDRSASMAEVLAARGLVLRSDLLRPWAHWITPEFEPKRFDTRFFVAAVPTGQRPRDVSGEADDTVWLPVAAAIAQHEARRAGDAAADDPSRCASCRRTARWPRSWRRPRGQAGAAAPGAGRRRLRLLVDGG